MVRVRVYSRCVVLDVLCSFVWMSLLYFLIKVVMVFLVVECWRVDWIVMIVVVVVCCM